MSRRLTNMLENWTDSLALGSPEHNTTLKEIFAEENKDKPNPNYNFEKMEVHLMQLASFNKNYHPSTKHMDEILLCYTFGELITNGIPILDCLKIPEASFKKFGHKKPAQALEEIYHSVRQGETIATPMNKIKLFNSEFLDFISPKYFSPETVYLTRIGEETGDLDKCLKKSASILMNKIKYNLNENQTGKILFYHGLGTLLNAGLPHLRSIRILEELSNKNDFGPSEETFEVLGNLMEGNFSAVSAFAYSRGFENRYCPRKGF